MKKTGTKKALPAFMMAKTPKGSKTAKAKADIGKAGDMKRKKKK